MACPNCEHVEILARPLGCKNALSFDCHWLTKSLPAPERRLRWGHGGPPLAVRLLAFGRTGSTYLAISV